MSDRAAGRAARHRTEPPAIELIEEAVHLLRGAPAGTLAIYYAGAVPFVLGLLFFWAHTTWFRPPGETVAWGALGLVGLFAAMKAMQAEFCARLLSQRLGAEPAPWAWRRIARLGVAQLRVQPWVVLGLGPAALIALPFGWLFAYGQSASVLGDDERLHEEAAVQSQLWPAQNHLGLLLLSVVGAAAWINLAAAFWLVPWLANRLLGLDNLFGFSGWWFLNTTFLASVTALTWLAVDPLVKAFYTLRVFHGRARRTGEDVRIEFRAARRAAAVLALLIVTGLPGPSARAAEAQSAVQPAELDRAIETVLAGADFRWRLPPTAETGDAKDGPITAFLRKGGDLVRDAFRAIGRWWEGLADWWERNFSRKDAREAKPGRAGDGAGALSALRLLLYLFLAGAGVLILWVIWLVWRQARPAELPALAAQAVAAAVPDLRDENVQAALLPADGWLALAREQAARGEWRLAWRALYLATLARLAAEGLVSLAKFKTNLDYERELRRRALSRGEVVAVFAARRRAFEEVWYGRAEPAETAVRQWIAELERPAAP
ncbi:MAG: hypothetical protein JNK23_17755 [Opitutaceae bacterium]|nr:hypothetical protein [Opitutaceae bacterium]